MAQKTHLMLRNIRLGGLLKPGGGAWWQLPGGGPASVEAGCAPVQKDNMGPSSHGLTICGRGQSDQMQNELGGGRKQGPRARLQKLAGFRGHGMAPVWQRTSPSWYSRLRRVHCTSSGSPRPRLGSGTSPVERCWIVFHSGVAHG